MPGLEQVVVGDGGLVKDEILLKTDLLIVGAGPAGASLACFLAAHGAHPSPRTAAM